MILRTGALCPAVELTSATRKLGRDPFSPLLLALFNGGRDPTFEFGSVVRRGLCKLQQPAQLPDLSVAMAPCLEKVQAVLAGAC